MCKSLLFDQNMYRHTMSDLWALPERRLAHTMADRVGEQFYSRCPEHLKPVLWRNKSLESSDEPISKEAAVDGSSAEDGSRRSPVPPTELSRSRWLRNPFKRGPKHDATKTIDDDTPPQPNFARIFFGALHATLLWRWWLAGLFKLVGGKYVPLAFFDHWSQTGL